MLVTPDRVLYAGWLGMPSVRTLGALTVYAASETPFAIRAGGRRWERACFAVVPPNQPHEIRSDDPVVWDLLLEPESVDVDAVLKALPRRISRPDSGYRRLQAAFRTWLEDVDAIDRTAPAIDAAFLGTSFAPRCLDPRIQSVVSSIRAEPCTNRLATECAREVGLSFSRFVHLFKSQIGVSFRSFCAWKRARALLPFVATAHNLTDLALHIGYPDSTHFSHSIRRIYGLRPRDIVTGSRQLTVVGSAASLAMQHEVPATTGIDAGARIQPRPNPC